MSNKPRYTIDRAAEDDRTDLRNLDGHESWRGVYYHLGVEIPTDEVLGE